MKRTNQKLKQNFWSNITVREHAASIFQMSGLQASCRDTFEKLHGGKNSCTARTVIDLPSSVSSSPQSNTHTYT